MLHTILYAGPFTPNFERLKKSKGRFRYQRLGNRGYGSLDDPPDKVDGVVFAYMEKSLGAGDGEHASFAVKVDGQVLDAPVRLIPDKHTDGKGLGPTGFTYFEDESAKRLLIDTIRANPKRRAGLTAIYHRHFGPMPKRIERMLAREKETNRPGDLNKQAIQQIVERQEALEGKIYRAEVTFRKRNRALIAAKKAKSDGRCKVCGFSFEEQYGPLDRDCLVAHHLVPIGHRQRASKTTLADIALLCPNCHVAAHTQDPPISLAELRRRLGRSRAKHS